MILYPAKVVPLTNGVGRCYIETSLLQSAIAEPVSARSSGPAQANRLCGLGWITSILIVAGQAAHG
jgi:hypothetical protein